MRFFLAVLLLLVANARAEDFAQPFSESLGVPGTYNATNAVSKATGTTTYRRFGSREAESFNVRDFGATGDGATDDSAAIAAGMNASLTAAAAGSPVPVYIPAGIYLIKAVSLPLSSWGTKIKGDGSHKTFIKVDPLYSGDVFAWSDAWSASTFNGTTLNPALDRTGASVEGITVTGDTSSSNTQNAFVFYDRNDYVYFRDVSVFFLKGSCLRIGGLRSTTLAYMRESHFSRVSCSNTGTASLPAVDISSTTANGSDATNEVKFFDLAIFAAAGTGIVIRNPNAFSATRLLEFYSLRVENSGGDNIQVSAAADLGGTNQLRFYGTQSITPGAANNGFYGISVGNGSLQDYDIQFIGGQIGNCGSGTCKGLKVDNVRLAKFMIGNISTTGTNVTYTANVGTNVVLDANGLEDTFTYLINAAAHVTAPTTHTVTP